MLKRYLPLFACSIFALLLSIVFIGCSDSSGGGPCGNGICESTETYAACPEDCSITSCGTGGCEANEDYTTCPYDCTIPSCGNSVCDMDETNNTCPADCACNSLPVDDDIVTCRWKDGSNVIHCLDFEEVQGWNWGNATAHCNRLINDNNGTLLDQQG